MSLFPLNIGDFDQRFTIKRPVKVESDGEQNISLSDLYTNVFAKEVKSGSKSNEKEEEGQVVGLDYRSFIIRKQDRNINIEDVIFLDSDNYYITAIDRYDRMHIKIECESRDND